MNVTFACPECEYRTRLELPASGEWQCPACDHLLLLAGPSASSPLKKGTVPLAGFTFSKIFDARERNSPLFQRAASDALSDCVVCGNRELYKKKDFPHWLGLTILTVACLGSVIPYWLYHQWWTWAILIGSAVLDGLLYLWVGDVIVCYRCQAQYRGCKPCAEHKPFELGIAERYRQERMRREQLQAAKKLQ